MVGLLLAARLILAAVIATAGIAKLADLNGSRRAVADFGLPARWAGPIGTLLPPIELAVAVSLVVAAPWPAGAAVALLLLLGFAGGMAFNLLRGRAPDCHCLGQVHSHPASWRAVTLDLVLAAVALTLVIAGAGTDMGPFGELAVGALILAGAISLTARARRGRRQEVQRGLPIGAKAPDFRLRALDGRTVTLASLREGATPLLLVFSKVDCGPCQALASDLADWQRRYKHELLFVVLECGLDDPVGADPHGRADVLIDRHCEVGRLYNALGTPTAVLVTSDGAIASSVAAGPDAVEALVANHLERLRLPTSIDTAATSNG